MKKNLFLCIALFLCSSIAVNGQELTNYQHEARIILPDGSEKEVILYANPYRPDYYQSSISTVDKQLFNSGMKIKNKHKIKYKAKDLKGYYVGDRLYESVKYADMTALGPGSLGATYFMEVLKEGEINLYKFYSDEVYNPQTPDEEIYEEVEKNSRILIQKGDDKVREVINVNIAEYISDEAEILDKFNNGGYGNIKSKEDDKGIAKFVKTSLNRENGELWVLEVVEDYNNEKLN